MFYRSKLFMIYLSAALLIIYMLPSASLAGEQNLVRKIVVFQGGLANGNAQKALLESYGAKALKRLPLINGMAVVLPEPAEAAIKLHGDVLRVEDDIIVSALPKPSDKPGKPGGGDNPQPPQVTPAGVDRIDAEAAWALGFTGAGVNVAVIDSGINFKHPDLADNCKGGINIINQSKSYSDDNGHGTHVAGIIAAVNNSIGVVGVAPEASLYGVKVLGRNGTGYASDVINGISWCIENNMDVINMSLGSNTDIQSLHDACDAAFNAGIAIVAAAGNDGGAVDFPAAYSSVIAVAATDVNGQRAYWSSYGPEVDIAAPGIDVLSTTKDGMYARYDGTSMAAPHVAGAIALNLSGDIFASADDLPPTGVDIYTGYGLVDAGEAATGIENVGDNLP